jgi:hypothetical protein
MNQWKASIAQRCVQVALTLDFYYSTRDHFPVSNMSLFLTDSSYKIIILHLSKEDSIA